MARLVDARDLKSIKQFVCASSILLTDSICWLYANGKQTGCDPVDVGSIPSGQPKWSVILTVKNSTDNRKIEVRLFYRPPYIPMTKLVDVLDLESGA